MYDTLLFQKKLEVLPDIKSINIPQFSNIDDLNGVLDIVYSSVTTTNKCVVEV